MIVNTDPVIGKRKGYNHSDSNSDNDEALLTIKNKNKKASIALQNLDKDV
jgi:hypothetical protein